MEAIDLLFVLFIVLSIVLWWIISTSYEKKVEWVKSYFISLLGEYGELLNLNYGVNTTGKKIKTWKVEIIFSWGLLIILI